MKPIIKPTWRLFILTNRKKLSWWIGGGLVGAILLIQLIYPGAWLLPFTKVDGLDVGGWKKTDAAWQLDQNYKQMKLAVYFGENSKPQSEPSLAEIGLKVGNDKRIQGYQYAWYWRLVPTSILWAHGIYRDSGPDYQRDHDRQLAYLDSLVGEECNVAATNASIEADGDRLKIIQSKVGGSCERNQVENKISTVEPKLNGDKSIHLSVSPIDPAISNQSAQDLADIIMKTVGQKITVYAGSEERDIAAKDVFSWLVFPVKDNQLIAEVSPEKSKGYLMEKLSSLVAKKPGTTYISTKDFTITNRDEGSSGRSIDIDKTATNLTYAVNSGEKVEIAVKKVNPTVVYDRKYTSTSTGIEALITNFAKDNKGTYGVAFQELGGEKRVASYRPYAKYTTASTYKLFVAYSTIKRVDSGKWKWSDKNIDGGRDRSQCFDDMIVKSDNGCAKSLLEAIGYQQITDEMNKLGLKDTSFTTGNTPSSTAADEAFFLNKLYNRKLSFKSASHNKMLDAMKRQVYRQGIPKGAGAPVADKVGFLWDLLHDAAIVYSPKGDYVLVIMTDKSSWANIAKLTAAIEALR